ncbi:MAG: DUF4129 domain-containing protein [Nostocaceae cyanobacterium]|nr:DUF4129 domain-containing protein [Nostocaceae cyanobacterium]
MSASDYEKTNLGWQLSQLQRQVGEWLEFQLNRGQPNSSPTSYQQPLWLENLLNVLVWLVGILLLAWLGWWLWRELRPYFYSRSRNISQHSQPKNPAKDLSMAGWVEKSQDYYRQGNYREACRCLYFAMLQHLHNSSVVPHKLSRTDGEYRQLVELSQPATRAYETLIAIHEQLCFSNQDILPEDYQQCRQAYQQLIGKS